ncbi:MAG: hypothetical protein K2W96_03785 [Gemmataceae bacterium]|nr:hypothetical protein [Gemmataceae bacterium]
MRKELTVTVGEDGVLKAALPLGAQMAGRVCRVVLEAVERPSITQEERVALVDRVAGSIADPAFTVENIDEPPEGPGK